MNRLQQWCASINWHTQSLASPSNFSSMIRNKSTLLVSSAECYFSIEAVILLALPAIALFYPENLQRSMLIELYIMAWRSTAAILI